MKYLNNIYTPEMSGKQGAVIFSSNQYGKYNCLRKNPIDHKTPAQMDVRSATKSIANLWTTLSPPQRQEWNNAATITSFVKKGVAYYISGFLLFMKYNKNLAEVNFPPIKDYPAANTVINPQEIQSLSVKIIDTPSGKDMMLYIHPAIADYTRIKLSATKHVKSSETFSRQHPHKIGYLDSAFVSGSSIKDLYIAKYGSLPTGSFKIFITFRSTNINSGISSFPNYVEVYP